MKYKKRLIDLRIENNMQQKQISNILGLSNDVYGHYEREETLIPIKQINALASFYNVSIDYIFEFSDERKYINSKSEINNTLSGKRLKEFRKEFKITQKDLSTFLNTSQSTISAYEHGETIILASFLYEICKKYNVSADYLLGKVDYPKYLK